MSDRRQFLNSMVRGGIFVSLSLLTGLLAGRRNKTGVCQENFACGGCRSSGTCRLPEADRHRLDKARGIKTSPEYGRTEK